MSWGYKIAILYGGFVILIVSMVSLTMREKIDLVSPDYYDQELKYQGKIDKMNLTLSLKDQLTWEVKQDELILNFPEQFKDLKISGSIYFFRPSDSALDKTIPLPADTKGIQRISTKQLKSGLYKMQVSWLIDKAEYFNEGIIQIK